MLSGLSEQDRRQIKAHGLSEEAVHQQIEAFKRGFPDLKLNRPCTVGDGITVLQETGHDRLIEQHREAELKGRLLKFVPASGAASRMFKSLQAMREKLVAERDGTAPATEPEEKDRQFLAKFITEIEKFAFYDALKAELKRRGHELQNLLQNNDYLPVLESLLAETGLNYAALPKGLIPFHRYDDTSRTAFEEQVVEGVAYAMDTSRTAALHFTIAPEHKPRIYDHFDEIKTRYENDEIRLQIEDSIQDPATDTIAVDMGNEPFRNPDGSLLFRPGGHGALLKNLDESGGDILIIKNIDNVVPDHLKTETVRDKKLLVGYLVELQKQLFSYLETLETQDANASLIAEMTEFARSKLAIDIPNDFPQWAISKQHDFLRQKLNRPLRVCGMVKNEGEPGGGPFWVEHTDGSISLQIVEKSQIDLTSEEQRQILAASTHFNPVDLVCAIRDFRDQPFDLHHFVDPETGFISTKYKDGKPLKALELPGLWNGSMADWNTVFVEVPLSTFSPVKTVNDLLRDEHQPAS